MPAPVIIPFLHWIWKGGGVLCLAAASVLALRRGALPRMEQWLARAERGRWARLGPALALGGALPATFLLFKLAQFQAFHLMEDSAILGNLAWNFAHGHGPVSSILGEQNYFGVHFAFTFLLVAPLLLLWDSIHILIAAQALAVASSALAVWLICRGRDLPRVLRVAVLLMFMANPLFHGLAISVLDHSVFAAPLLLWSACCWLARRKVAAVGLAILALTAREQVPLVFLGLGAMLAVQGPDSGRRRAGAVLALASVGVFLAETEVISRYRPVDGSGMDFWRLFGHLGGSSREILAAVFVRPWAVAQALVYPWEKIATAGRVLFGFAFLPLLAGPVFLPGLAAWLPHQLAASGTVYHLLEGGHYGSYVLAPFLLAAVCGAERVWRASGERGREVLAAWIFAVAGGMFLSRGFLLPEGAFPRHWRDTVALAERHIPRDAKLWCDEYLAPRFALRRRLRILPRSDQARFRSALFAPDRVLLSGHWIARSDPAFLDRLFTFFRSAGYVRIFEREDLVVLAPREAGGAPLPLRPVRF